MKLKTLLSACALALSTAAGANWDATLAAARGQTVYFNHWGGSDAINRYVDWAATKVQTQYGVTVKSVKLDDAASVVARILAERSAGRERGGSVDLIWVNGENFRTLKHQDLLHSAWTAELPNYALVDTAGKPTTTVDFGEPVEHLEAPWGMAQLVFMHDSAALPEPPRSMDALADYAAAHPGRVSYPKPPAFHGTTFLKQALLELVEDPAPLQQPVEASDAAALSAPLWAYLDALHPHLWRGGENFPADGGAMRQLLDDGELDIAMSFNPNEASRAIADGQLAASVRTYIHDGGTIGNTHFVAIPFNSDNAAGAKVFANFLLSPQAQARKADPAVWGDPTVLDMAALDEAGAATFAELPLGIATLSAAEMSPTLAEPHASWVSWIEAEWQRRYGR